MPGIPPIVPLIFFLFVLGAIVFAIVAYLRNKARREAFAREAERLGLRYVENGDKAMLEAVKEFSIMSAGHSRQVKNLVDGVHGGHSIRYFDYRYTTGSGKSSQTHLVGVAVCQGLPVRATLRIVPETFGHKVWDALGGDDIDFEWEEFSRTFWVKCGDRKFAYDVVNARMMEFLMEPGWRNWELTGGILMVWNPRWPEAAELQSILDRVAGFADRMPSFLRTATAVPLGSPV